MTLLVSALSAEAEAVAAHSDWEKEYDWNGYAFRRGVWTDGSYSEPIALIQTGVGKTQSAMVTQRAIDEFEPERIIMFGAAGALDPDVRIGDIVVASDVLQHDLDATILGIEKGTIPYTGIRQIPSDPELVAMAMEVPVPESAELAAFDAENPPEPDHKRVRRGRIVSGDEFVSDPFYRIELNEEFEALAVEMEGASVALVALVNHVPFVLIRTISDRSDGSAMEFEQFLGVCSSFSWHYVSHMLRTIASAG